METILPGLQFAIKHNLTQSEMKIVALMGGDPISSKELSDTLKVDKTSISHYLVRLELKGVIEVVRTEVSKKFWKAVSIE